MDKPSYFRRCHLCGEITKVDEHYRIESCEHCGKPLAKFQYFDDRFTPVQSDRTLRPPPLAGEICPIQGLTVYWESF